ncbi:MAG: hypothetical protein G8D28_06600 [gamma proteobacterium symbiont of Phacoides pectinatus]
MDANRSLIDRLHRLNAIGIALSAERETPPRLLERILDSARSLTNADGGTLLPGVARRAPSRLQDPDDPFARHPLELRSESR